MLEDKPAVVIDNGSGICKAGFSGSTDDLRTAFPSVMGTPKYQNLCGMTIKDQVREEAIAKKGILKLKYPITNGIVSDWEDMTRIWHHCFYNELRVTPTEQPCLLTEAPRSPLKQRQKIMEIMFETFNVPAFYLASSAPLSLFSAGRTTGMVLEVGDGVSYAAPIIESQKFPYATEMNRFGGRDLTQFLSKLLNEVGLNYISSAQMETVKDIKENKCSVAVDYDTETQNETKHNIEYQLPDGQTIQIGSQRFRCPESLFKPQLLFSNTEILSLHQMVYKSIMGFSNDTQKELYSNIVMCGGTTFFPGIKQRLMKQLLCLAPSTAKIKIDAPAERKFQTWIGGSILSSFSTFQSMWVSKAEYKETGAKIVHEKCCI